MMKTTTPQAIDIPAGDIQAGDHQSYMKLALSLATESPPKPTNYRVGAVVVDVATNKILATGYTLELPGNTHAEQCCFEKLAEKSGVSADRLGEVLPDNVALYTTVEPCSQRLSGNLPCVDRILAIGSKIKTVYVGVYEPDKFVNDNSSKQKLKEAGIGFVHIAGLEKDILEVATAGHERSG
ncbi:cytidine deaminase-like protein [Hypoxylon sp. NC1633]|nr:cytidine deaminase-like protein [Hypoxylon sp. NC1633]